MSAATHRRGVLGALCGGAATCAIGIVAIAGALTCNTGQSPDENEAGIATGFDCVGVLHVTRTRGDLIANVHRLGRDNPPFRETLRLSELDAGDLADFCDWEACVRTNGYSHVCSINDAGWERCRVCEGGTDCGDLPTDRAACMAHAKDPARSACHVGLMQECLIQRGLRGFADPRVTQTCVRSEESCAGELPGDLRAQALAAQHETDQVTIEVFRSEVALAADLEPDSPWVTQWYPILAQWDGGVPTDVSDGSAPPATDR